MKKITVFLVFVLCLFSFNVLASEMTLFKSFYAGSFKLEKVNWNDEMEIQFLGDLSGLPDILSFVVYGYTDKTGTEEYNLDLAQRRANFIADKLANLFPDSPVKTIKMIYKPEDGQKVNYRMDVIKVYAEPRVAIANLEDSLLSISTILKDIKEKPVVEVENIKQVVDLSKIENSLNFIADSLVKLKVSQSDLSKSSNLADSDRNSYLQTVKKSFEDIQKLLFQTKGSQNKKFENISNDNRDIKKYLNEINIRTSDSTKRIDDQLKYSWLYIAGFVLNFLLLVVIISLLSIKKRK